MVGGAWCPSPLPRAIVELDMINCLAKEGYVVIACGGAGSLSSKMPRGNLVGVEAVIDKDFASSLLAREIGAELLLVSTAVEKSPSTSIGPISNGWIARRWLKRRGISRTINLTRAAWDRKFRR